jgi:ABC-type glycerol-3-phosphate transport system substrate-binding protein
MMNGKNLEIVENPIIESKCLHFWRTGTARSSLKYLPVLVLVLTLFISGCTEKSPGGVADSSLAVIVADAGQVKGATDVANRYENATGVPVSIIPGDGSSQGPGNLSGDILIANITTIQRHAARGELVPLNSMLMNDTRVNWTCFERPVLVMAGEYPARSGTIYALPFSQDALGIVYRADLLRDPNESAVFCQTYGYPLGLPGTYHELSDLARFFTRNTTGLYGIGFAGLDGPDASSSPWMSILGSYGSGILDRTGHASGTWNTTDSISALLVFRNLSDQQPPGAGSWTDADVAEAFSTGKLAMAITWFSRFSDLQSAADEHNLSVDYMPLPGEMTDKGSHREISVRISGISLINGGDKEKSEAFIAWLYSPEVQMEYAKAGYQPSIVQVQDSYPYLSLNGYNRAFPESMRVGITPEKDASAVDARKAGDGLVRQILASGSRSPQDLKPILDSSAASLDHQLTPGTV